MGLNFNFAAELMLDPRFQQLLFEENLERHDELALLLPSQIYVAKFTLAEGLANFEIVDGPATLIDLIGLGGLGSNGSVLALLGATAGSSGTARAAGRSFHLKI